MQSLVRLALLWKQEKKCRSPDCGNNKRADDKKCVPSRNITNVRITSVEGYHQGNPQSRNQVKQCQPKHYNPTFDDVFHDPAKQGAKMVVRRGSERILEADVLQQRSEEVLRARGSPREEVLKASGNA